MMRNAFLIALTLFPVAVGADDKSEAMLRSALARCQQQTAEAHVADMQNSMTKDELIQALRQKIAELEKAAAK